MERIFIYAGKDIATLVILNSLIPHLADRFEVEILLCSRKNNSKLPEAYLRYLYLESQILDDLLASKCNRQTGAKYLLLEPLSTKFGIRVHHVSNVNDENIVKFAAKKGTGNLSIRCSQKFSKQFIQAVHNTPYCFLWNLHPAKLPSYRGILPLFHEMQYGDREGAFTLHEISEGLDEGPILSTFSLPILYDTLFENLISIPEGLAEGIKDSISKYSISGHIESLTQDQKNSRYFSYPNVDEVEQFYRNGKLLYRVNSVIKFYEENFGFDPSDLERIIVKSGIPLP